MRTAVKRTGKRWKLESWVTREGVPHYKSIELDERTAFATIETLSKTYGPADYEQKVGLESWQWEVTT